MPIATPRDIPGLILWLSADDLATKLDNGAIVTQWDDLSGQNNHAVQHVGDATDAQRPVLQLTAGISNKPAVKFNGRGMLKMPTEMLYGRAAAEAVIHTKANGDPAGLWGMGNASAECHFTYDGSIYEAFGSNNRTQIGGMSSQVQGLWKRYNASSENMSQIRRLNNVVVHTASNPVDWPNPVNTKVPQPIIGGSSLQGNNTHMYSGWISAMVIYSRVLTAQERSDLDAWFVANPSGGLLPDPPTAVQNLREASADKTSIGIVWDPSATGAPSSYEFRVDGGSWASTTGLATTTSGLAPDTQHTFEVRALNAFGSSPPSSLVASTLPIPAPEIPWNDPNNVYFSTGVDRGVLYSEDGVVAFNGIIGVTEAGAGSASVLYRDGQIFYADVEPGDYAGTLTTFFWPPEFDKCIGVPEVAPGLHLDYQRPRRFSLSYRSLIGSGTEGDMFGYQIHLIYNALASPQSRTRKTKTNSPSLDEFSFDLVAIPPRIVGYRPTSHLIIDTRNLSKTTVAELEDLIYNSGSMPDATLIYETLKFGSSITFAEVGGGKIRASGASANIETDPSGKITIRNVTATLNASGSYTLSDTP